MIPSELERAQRELKKGDTVAMTLRGNYHNYTVQGRLESIQHGRVFLQGCNSHHYQRIISMCKVEADQNE